MSFWPSWASLQHQRQPVCFFLKLLFRSAPDWQHRLAAQTDCLRLNPVLPSQFYKGSSIYMSVSETGRKEESWDWILISLTQKQLEHVRPRGNQHAFIFIFTVYDPFVMDFHAFATQTDTESRHRTLLQVCFFLRRLLPDYSHPDAVNTMFQQTLSANAMHSSTLHPRIHSWERATVSAVKCVFAYQ